MILFTDMIIYKDMMGMGEKTPKEKRKRKKKILVSLPSNPHFDNIEAESFSVSENSKSKPDLP